MPHGTARRRTYGYVGVARRALMLLGAGAGRVENEDRIRCLYFVMRGGGADETAVLKAQSTIGGNLHSLATYARIRAGIDFDAVPRDCDSRRDRGAPWEFDRPSRGTRRSGENVRRCSGVATDRDRAHIPLSREIGEVD